MLDGCGFAFFFFPSYNGLDQPLGSAWLRFCFCNGWLFLWWLVVILVDGCGYILGIFIFYFIPIGDCGCHSGAVTCGGGGYGGLWLLQWWLWQVEWW